MKIACVGGGVSRTTVAAAAFGFARRAYDEALPRARGRELFGGDGVVSGTPVERLHRETRPPGIYAGTNGIQNFLLARHESRKSKQGSTCR